ncbi:MAG: glycosyltransferase family 2 protein [Spirochaetaceae bacterium]|nr:glycosyltransferase family 2 protein [Spirochaetaceae bacterium]
MKITVIIPTYKPDYTLYECLDSLSRQTLSVDEFDVVLILNGEQHPYEQEIQHYLNNSPLKIQYIYSLEKGVSNARNIGIKHATGDYITFIDSDDWVSENYLTGLLEKTNGSQMALAKVQRFDDLSKRTTDIYLTQLYDSLDSNGIYNHIRVKSYFSVPFGKLLPTVICKKTSFSRKFDYGEDGLFMFSMEPDLPVGVKASEDVIYFYRFKENSLSNKTRNRGTIIKTHIFLLCEYWKLYLSKSTRYNLFFFINRNLAVLKHIILCR